MHIITELYAFIEKETGTGDEGVYNVPFTNGLKWICTFTRLDIARRTRKLLKKELPKECKKIEFRRFVIRDEIERDFLEKNDFPESPRPLKINKLYAFICNDNGPLNEGLMAMGNNPNEMNPFVAADLNRAKSLLPIADIACKSYNKEFKIQQFDYDGIF